MVILIFTTIECRLLGESEKPQRNSVAEVRLLRSVNYECVFNKQTEERKDRHWCIGINSNLQIMKKIALIMVVRFSIVKFNFLIYS